MSAPCSTPCWRRPRWRRPRRALRAVLIGLLAGIGAVGVRAGRDYEVAGPAESIRTTPDGQKIGQLAEGARVEEVGRDGNWVKFRLEGWIWGPSLEGFQAQSTAAPGGDTDGGGAARREADRKPRSALGVHLEEVRQLIEERYGRFYGLRRDPDLDQVQVRFRVRDLEPDAFERRQMHVQFDVLRILEGDVDFESLRVESNRADGTGQVGAEVAVTAAADIRRAAGDDLALWRQTTRRSTDGGKTWTQGPR